MLFCLPISETDRPETGDRLLVKMSDGRLYVGNLVVDSEIVTHSSGSESELVHEYALKIWYEDSDDVTDEDGWMTLRFNSNWENTNFGGMKDISGKRYKIVEKYFIHTVRKYEY